MKTAFFQLFDHGPAQYHRVRTPRGQEGQSFTVTALARRFQAGQGFIQATAIRGPSVVVRLLNKNMPIGLVALLACCGLVEPTLAQPDGKAPDARALGVTEAMLDYCAKAYPASAEKYQFQIKRLTQGASQETLAKVRSSEQYRRAHDAEGDFVSKVDPRNAKRACSKPLVARK